MDVSGMAAEVANIPLSIFAELQISTKWHSGKIASDMKTVESLNYSMQKIHQSLLTVHKDQTGDMNVVDKG